MIIPDNKNNQEQQQTMMLCEQGDLGLFCDPISKEEQKAYNESNERLSKEEN